MVTIYDVAKRAGVSTATVSRVINQERYVAPQTREKVLRVLEELNFFPNRNASSLTKGRTNTIAVVIPDINNPFFTGVVRGIQDKADEQELLVLICNTDEESAREKRYLALLMEKRVDGVILASTAPTARHLHPFLQQRVALVLLDREPAGANLDLVRSDHRGGARALVEHLLALGHRRIAMIGGPKHLSSSKLRREGYLEALRGAGIQADPALIQPGDYQETGGWKATRQLMALAEPPTAIFAANNFEAIGAFRALRELGYRVPEDVSLVCFDEVGQATTLSPFLTVAAQPLATIGGMAVELLTERLRGERGQQEPRREVVFSAEVIVRASTAPPRTQRRR